MGIPKEPCRRRPYHHPEIEDDSKKLKLPSSTLNNAGNQLTIEFTCTVDGKECEFSEGGHKSKISMWFLGDALNVCKTNGPAGDVVNQWKLQPSLDGTELTLTINHIEPTTTDEVIVFRKTGP